jgi:alpha-tubulin suppressor-like RCC1 family protein
MKLHQITFSATQLAASLTRMKVWMLAALVAGAWAGAAARGQNDGSIVAWGRNDLEQCNVPEPNLGFVAVAAGTAHSLGLKANGSIVAWGLNNYGQCDVPEPNSGFVTVAAGDFHSLGLKDDGSIKAWGNNGRGQCDVPPPNTG